MKQSTVMRDAWRTAESKARQNASWLQKQMAPHFFRTLTDEPKALGILTREMNTLQHNRYLMLADREKQLIVACKDEPGSLFHSLNHLHDREISCAIFSQSLGPMPDMEARLEVQNYEFDRKSEAFIARKSGPPIPGDLQKNILKELSAFTPSIPRQTAERLLNLLWLNSPDQIRFAPPAETAGLVWLFERGNASGGLFVDIQKAGDGDITETKLLFAVGNPPQKGFLQQLVEVFNRLKIGIRTAHCLTISNGIHPYFLGTFYILHQEGCDLSSDSKEVQQLKLELCNTQILSNNSYTYRTWVAEGIMSGDDAALVNSFTAFCHTNLAHSQPDRFRLEDVQSAFHTHPEMTMQFIKLFKTRFDPTIIERDSSYQNMLADTIELIDEYNTGHRWLDEIRIAIYQCCLQFITHTLKTNFFCVEKQALSFRLDPAYLKQLDSACIEDLPKALPFRITFFFSRFGHGYHIGFSDIARGGWRTVIARNQDDAITTANTLFREVYVLAHTQHLKNTDIYEGGSKLVLVMDASELEEGARKQVTSRLYKLQYSVTNAFLDIFVTEDGKAKDPRIVDYYGDDEPIELGPDENMHDSMIEAIAALSVKRGYLLGTGIMSSKKVGINHKEYGVTSTGVMTFAEVVMASQGVNIHQDSFTIKMTGGPGGDVAGNSLKIILESCPNAKIVMILDGTAAVLDPNGLNKDELRKIALKHDLDGFDPARLSNGGTMIFRTGKKMDGLREMYRKITRASDGRLQEQWIPLSDFLHEYVNWTFEVEADLFIPAGGRPETIDDQNWQDFLKEDGTPSSKVIIEGANSFITPEARDGLQKAGVVLMRDSSANKCGVISSSYEIIANLILTEKEFLTHKERYVADVLEILKKRAYEEASLILQRWEEAEGTKLYTDISEEISYDINGLYHRLFQFFTDRPELCLQAPFKSALIRHLPKMLQEEARFRNRLSKLPVKYLAAMLAAEVGASIVYSSSDDADFEDMIRRHLLRIEA